MKYVRECVILFGITLAGELLNLLLPLPVPAGVYGLFLLLILLCGGIVKLGDIEATGNFLLDIMPVLFIPASVGLIESFDAIRVILAPIVIISVVSTIVVMVVTGKAAEAMLRFTGRKKGAGERHKEGERS